MTSKIFISYRREDGGGHAGRVHDRLARELGTESLFMDVDAIPLGSNFVKVLREEVGRCQVLLALIGPRWLEARDEHGRRRLDDPNDFVRVEIATALARDIAVIPILFDGAPVPGVAQLPDNLKELSVRNGLQVHHASFHADMDKLIGALKKTLADAAPIQPRDTAATGVIRLAPTTSHAAAPPSVAPGPQAERRQMTILSCQMVSNLPPDPEELHDLIDRFRASCRAQVEETGGTVSQQVDDWVVAHYGYPATHEDDAERAVRAALAILDATAVLTPAPDVGLQARIGIASGVVVVREVARPGAPPERSATGSAATLAARLQSLAEPGAVVVSPDTHRLVSALFEFRDLGKAAVQGFAEPVHVRQVLGANDAGGLDALFAARGPLVGRQFELEQLKATLEACLATGRGRTVYIRGEAGIGKTRLLTEFLATAKAKGFDCHAALVLDFGAAAGRDAIGALARALLGEGPSGGGDAMTAALDHAFTNGLVERNDEVFLNDLMQVPQPLVLRAVYDAMDNATRAAGKRAAIVRMIEQASRRQPVVLAVEDLHWADPTTLAHLAALAATVTRCPAVLVMTARFERDPIDERWRAEAGMSPLTMIDLGPLHPEEAATLAGQVLGGDAEMGRRCVERAAGNPLFLEQLLRNAADGDTSSVPASVHSLVQARLDRLDAGDKAAFQAASVLGQRFEQKALAHLLDVPDFDPARILAGRMIHTTGEEVLFAHALIHEAIYDSLLKNRRSELHRRAAAWFAGRDASLKASHLDRAADPAAATAYLEAAQVQRREYRHDAARRLVERGLELAADRADRFALSSLLGDILSDLGDMPAALGAYERALAQADTDAQRCHAWIGCAHVKRVMDDYDGAFSDVERAEAVAVALGLRREEAQLRFLRGNLYFPRGDFDGCLREHGRSLALAREVGAPELEAEALGGLGDAEYMRGRMISASRNFQACISLATHHGFGRIASANRPMAVFPRWLSGEVNAALADARAAIEAARRVGHQRAEMIAHHAAYFCLHDLLELQAAAEHAEKALLIAQRLRAPRFEAQGLAFWAEADRLVGRRETAQAKIETALAISRKSGMTYMGPFILGTMALIVTDEQRRRELLGEADALLEGRAVRHNHILFGRDAIEVCLDMEDWALAEHYALTLAAHTSAEPLPWSDFFIARGRALAAVGQDRAGRGHREVLLRLLQDAEGLRCIIAMPALRDALARVED